MGRISFRFGAGGLSVSLARAEQPARQRRTKPARPRSSRAPAGAARDVAGRRGRRAHRGSIPDRGRPPGAWQARCRSNGCAPRRLPRRRPSAGRMRNGPGWARQLAERLLHALEHALVENIGLDCRDVPIPEAGLLGQRRRLPARRVGLRFPIGKIGQDGFEAHRGSLREILGSERCAHCKLRGDVSYRLHREVPRCHADMSARSRKSQQEKAIF